MNHNTIIKLALKPDSGNLGNWGTEHIFYLENPEINLDRFYLTIKAIGCNVTYDTSDIISYNVTRT